MDLKTLTIPNFRISNHVREHMPEEHRYIHDHYNAETIVVNKKQLAYIYASVAVQGARYHPYIISRQAIEYFIRGLGFPVEPGGDWDE